MTFELLQQESPEYRNAVDDEFTKESKSHCGELLGTIVAIARGQVPPSDADPLAFVRTHAQWRARRQVPLTASMHAYRLAHKTYWRVTRERLSRHPKKTEALRSLAMLSDFWMDLFDCVGAVLAEAHSVEEGLTIAQNTRAYVCLIDDLLRGIESDGAEAKRLRTLCGIRSRAPKAVIVGRLFQSESDDEIDREVALRSLVRLIQQVLPSAVFGKVVDTRNGEVTAIVCSDGDTSRGVLNTLRKHGFGRRPTNGIAAGFGVSLDTTEIRHLIESHEEARIALDFTSAARPLMHFSDIDLTRYLVRRADKAAIRLVPDRTRRLISADGAQGAELLDTIHAFADCSLNVKQTARRLKVHINTVYFRLNRIKDVTGIDPRTYSGISLLMTAHQLMETQTVADHLRSRDRDLR